MEDVSLSNMSIEYFNCSHDEEFQKSKEEVDQLLKKIESTNNNENENSEMKQRKRFPFTKEEDDLLVNLVQLYGIDDKSVWHLISYHMKSRSARQCRERYQLFLSETVRKKAKWTKEEDELLLSQYARIGPHWKKMEQFFLGRTSYNIKNRFKSLIKPRQFQPSNVLCNHVNSIKTPPKHNDFQKPCKKSHNLDLQINPSFYYSSEENKNDKNITNDIINQNSFFDDNYQNELLDFFFFRKL